MMTCYCVTEFKNQNVVSNNRSEARLIKHNTLCRWNVSRPSRLSSAAPVGWHVSADLLSSSLCRSSGHAVEEPSSRSTASLGFSQFFLCTDDRSQFRSSCSRTVRTLSAVPLQSRSYIHESSRLNSSRNNSLLDRLLDPTSLFSRSRPSIDQSIPPFNRPVYPTIQSTNLSHRCHHEMVGSSSLIQDLHRTRL